MRKIFDTRVQDGAGKLGEEAEGMKFEKISQIWISFDRVLINLIKDLMIDMTFIRFGYSVRSRVGQMAQSCRKKNYSHEQDPRPN